MNIRCTATWYCAKCDTVLFGTRIGTQITHCQRPLPAEKSDNININLVIGGLAPVIIGSALGIFVYAWGNIRYKQTVELTGSKEAEYLDIYFKIDNEHYQTRVTNLEDVYSNLFKPLNNILNKFNKISKNFDEFNTTFAENIAWLLEKIT